MDQKPDLLGRRVAKVIPSKDKLQELLDSGKKLRLYQGFDPTGNRLHLGHTVGLRKLMDFANAGHEVIFLFGTGTVLVGDPSERDTGRKLITQEEIDQNIKNWQQQVSSIVDFDKVIIKQNGDWLVGLTLKDIVNIASNISAIQLFKRDSFQRRLDKGDTVWYHETMYPLLQGYDSVAMDVDLEIGGTDQEFNMLIGRELQRKMKGREKFVLTTPMILGTDGSQMSKTSGNCVWLDDTPQDMYGKLMSIPDAQIVSYLREVTDIPMKKVGEIANNLDSGSTNPIDAKKELALAVTTDFHGQDKARQAQSHFESTVQQGQIPTGIASFTPSAPTLTSSATLVEANLGSSNSERKRVITQGGFEIDGQKITDPQQETQLHDGSIVKFGKREYRRIKLDS